MDFQTKNRLRIGILTFHRSIDYGSFWQARCLVENLRERGCDAVLLDYRSLEANLAEWKCSLRPFLPVPAPRRDIFFYGVKLLKFMGDLSSLPRSRPFTLEKPSEMEWFDLVVIGSDEVWNVKHPRYGGCGLFFGDGLRTRHLVSYAASFGNYSAAGGLDPKWVQHLRSFEAISVRDNNSREIIRKALGQEPPLVLDPCLLEPPPVEGEWHGPQRPFVAVYGQNFSTPFSSRVARWAKKRGLELVSIGYRNDWADHQWIAANPQDFVQCMARAEAVATNFFHGCVFALQNAKPFVAEKSPYQCHRMQALLESVGEEKRLVAAERSSIAHHHNLSTPLEDKTLRTIWQLREHSGRYLENALAIAA